ncbi:MAG: DoxX family protein [Caldilineaceae bacterium]|nr:DoxX family protein [Caldilineaceae bacterium]
MQTGTSTNSTSKPTLWTSRILMALVVLFLLFDSITKIMKVSAVVEASAQLGVNESQLVGIGIVLLICTVLYLIPQTAILGAILLTGYLGGAVATNTLAAAGLFPMVFPVIFGGLAWLALYLRNRQLRDLIPVQR